MRLVRFGSLLVLAMGSACAGDRNERSLPGVSHEITPPVEERAEPSAPDAAAPADAGADAAEVPGKRKRATCRLPEALFPARADRRVQMVVEPGEGLVQTFDPRLYCFAAGGQTRLVPGALIHPHLGWPAKSKTVWHRGKRETLPGDQVPPFVATAAPASETNEFPLQEEICGNA